MRKKVGLKPRILALKPPFSRISANGFTQEPSVVVTCKAVRGWSALQSLALHSDCGKFRLINAQKFSSQIRRRGRREEI
jgi:hypothetical protein